MRDREKDIKWEGKQFFVIYSPERKRYEVCRNGVTCADVYGHGEEAACIRTAQKLDRYAHMNAR